ncbi:hypothetical protein E0L36_03900 [Streptomyces sp. AJS327]|uniref:hypothetical protein n=1 Tax=Streptomyces sp. AJS327 TaxID=2545265 RepID=UPI0015DDBD90|nr:hypothetical protein [Streptomyces sp. AJS327]MBA0050073.1 hypothetical protein [Streptomyces sp. AJS327]
MRGRSGEGVPGGGPDLGGGLVAVLGATVNGWAQAVGYVVAAGAVVAVYLWCALSSRAPEAAVEGEPEPPDEFLPRGFGAWSTGRCGLYCGREDVRVTPFRTVAMPWGRLALFGCVPCLRQLTTLERARNRELTAPLRTPIGAGLPSPVSPPELTPTPGDPPEPDRTTAELPPRNVDVSRPSAHGARVSRPSSNSPLWYPRSSHDRSL